MSKKLDSCIVIERAIELSLSQQSKVDTGLSEQVECCGCVQDEATPQIHGELGVVTADDGG